MSRHLRAGKRVAAETQAAAIVETAVIEAVAEMDLADAAATVRALVRLWGIHMDSHDLFGLALSLGADVPVCLYGRTAYMRGVGELIEPGVGTEDVELLHRLGLGDAELLGDLAHVDPARSCRAGPG